jgi:hypothetical protein
MRFINRQSRVAGEVLLKAFFVGADGYAVYAVVGKHG